MVPAKARKVFWSRVVINKDECWSWDGPDGNDRYIKFSANNERFYAHRLSYALHYEEPGDKNVCHHCDNPRCCNPEHLFLGTQSDNMQDASEKGRISRGETSGINKLTREEVMEIRKRYWLEFDLVRDLADEYDVSKNHLYSVVRGKKWAHLSMPDTSKRPERLSMQGENHPHAVFTKEERAKARQMYHNGDWTHESLGEYFGVSSTTIWRAIKNEYDD